MKTMNVLSFHQPLWSTKCIFCSKGPATFDVRFIVLRSALTPYHHAMAPWSALKSWNANTNLLPLCDLSTPSSAWYLSFPFSRLTSEVYPDLHRHVTSLPPFFFSFVFFSPLSLLSTLGAMHAQCSSSHCSPRFRMFCVLFSLLFCCATLWASWEFLGGVVSFIVKTWNFLEVGVASCLC